MAIHKLTPVYTFFSCDICIFNDIHYQKANHSYRTVHGVNSREWYKRKANSAIQTPEYPPTQPAFVLRFQRVRVMLRDHSPASPQAPTPQK